MLFLIELNHGMHKAPQTGGFKAKHKAEFKMEDEPKVLQTHVGKQYAPGLFGGIFASLVSAGPPVCECQISFYITLKG